MSFLPAVFALPAVALVCGSWLWFETLSRRTEPWVDLPVVEYDFADRDGWTWCGMDFDVVVRRAEDGGVETLVRGECVSRRELPMRLLVFAERKRDMEHPDQPSEVRVNIRAGRDVPWAEVRRVLEACQDPDVRIYKLAFAVYPPTRIL